MTQPDADKVSKLLALAQQGERRATDELVAVLYDELKRVAASLLRGSVRGTGPVTLQSTALVNEAYMRLQGGRNTAWESRAHFFGAAARAMRQILIDRARSARVGRRSDAAVESMSVSMGADGAPTSDEEMISLDQAMASLEARDSRQHDVVMLRFFAGLTVDQTADVLEVSPATVKNDWSYARAWLLREIKRARAEGGRSDVAPGGTEQPGARGPGA
ncbi:MAG: ECF-type sigma factor [Phycisphaerales bacterium]